MSQSPRKIQPKWHHPMEVMKIHQMKLKKKALQARIKGNVLNTSTESSHNKSSVFEDILSAKKRKNPFLIEKQNDKKNKIETLPVPDVSNDQTLFKLLHQNVTNTLPSNSFTSFNNLFNKAKEVERIEIVKAKGESWLPIDWTLKSKIRLLSEKPFPWSSKLRISEETSGLVSFTRCLVSETETTLDTSPNAKFHQCCLFWQQPYLPWVSLFPRINGKISTAPAGIMNASMRENLHHSWTDSLRSLFQLIRTRQCPYFYVCANNFTVLFRAAGINGFSDIHALITPTTRGFRQSLRQEDIVFTLPLKKKRTSDHGYDTQESTLGESCERQSENNDSALPDDDEDEETPDEEWLKSMGINAEDIKQINYTQEKIMRKNECEIDNGEQSLLLVQGIEVHPLYNFLINCKSATANTGNLAGIPPTILAPVSFLGGTLQSLKVRESKVHVDDADLYSLELIGPILPTLIHNLFAISPPEHNVSVTFVSIPSMIPLSKITHKHSQESKEAQGSTIFGKENLSDCGLNPRVLKHFCSTNPNHLYNTECLKYTSENKTYTWT